MIESRLNDLIAIYRDGLLKDILPFWQKHCVDQQFGGFTMALNRDGTLIDSDKGVWQQARFTWLLGELYNNVEPREEWLDLALHGIRFIEKYCFDAEDGRMWFHLTRSGEPIRKRRYSFTESFAAIAYGELAKATGEKKYAEKAEALFRQFVHNSLEQENVEPKFTNIRPVRGIGLPMITINTAQELRDSIGLHDANDWIDRSINDIRQYHLKPDIQCVMETVGQDGAMIDHFDGRTLNPGHAIEGAWFIMQEGRLRKDDELLRTGCQMLDWMWKRGWDDEFGGMLYFVDVNDLPVQEYWHDMKFWWPQNETIIATLLAYSLTSDEKYSDWHHQIHDWTYAHFPDPKYGEWFGYLARDGRITSRAKGNLWKGPFHIPRMQYVCWKILDRMHSPDPISRTDAT